MSDLIGFLSMDAGVELLKFVPIRTLCGALAATSKQFSEIVGLHTENDPFWKKWVAWNVRPRHSDSFIERIPGPMRWRYYARMHAPLPANTLHVPAPEMRPGSPGHLPRFTVREGEITAAATATISEERSAILLAIKGRGTARLEVRDRRDIFQPLFGRQELAKCVVRLVCTRGAPDLHIPDVRVFFALGLTTDGEILAFKIVVSPRLPGPRISALGPARGLPKIASLGLHYFLAANGEVQPYFFDTVEKRVAIFGATSSGCLRLPFQRGGKFVKDRAFPLPDKLPSLEAIFLSDLSGGARPLFRIVIVPLSGWSHSWIIGEDWTASNEQNTVISDDPRRGPRMSCAHLAKKALFWRDLPGKVMAAVSPSGSLYLRKKSSLEKMAHSPLCDAMQRDGRIYGAVSRVLPSGLILTWEFRQ